MVAMLLDFFGHGSIMQPETLQPYIDGEKKEEVLEGIASSPRTLMQTLGTDWGRNIINKDLWLNCMEARLKAYVDCKNLGYKGAFVIVTDVRFDNEAQKIKDLGGTVVQIARADAPEQVGAEQHASEAGVSPHLIDVTVDNSGTVEEFQDALIKALGSLPALPDYPVEQTELFSEESEESTDVVEERSEALT
jgi:hypothetical protein